jgi:hypothetical protein
MAAAACKQHVVGAATAIHRQREPAAMLRAIVTSSEDSKGPDFDSILPIDRQAAC